MSVSSLTRRTLLLGLLVAGCARAQPTSLSYDGLVAALEESGASVETVGDIEQVFFSVPGRSLRVDGADVQVFEYVDEAARQADSDLISTDGSTIGTSMVTWIDQPNFWAEGRLIVLYVGREAAVFERLSGVLGDPLTEPWPRQG